MENIRKTERVHTISCLIHSVSQKIREGLKKLGYIHYTHNEKAECILVDPYAEDFTRIANIKYDKSNPKCIWIAREEDIEDKYSDAFIPGILNLFYDKPSYVYNSEKGRKEWGCARKIAEIPNYMYPNVTFENSPIKFKMEV